MTLYKRKDSKYWYCNIYESPTKQLRVSTGTADKKTAKAFHDALVKKTKADRQQNRLNKLLGIEVPEDQKSLFPIKDLYRKANSLKAFSFTQERNYKIFFNWYIDKFSKLDDIKKINKKIALHFLSLKYGNAAPKTYNNTKSSLSSIWKILAVYDIENPWMSIPNKSGDSEPYRALSDNEIKTLYKNAYDYWKHLIIICLYTGLRIKDVCNLKWDMVKDDYVELIPAKTKRYKRAVRIYLHPRVKYTISQLKRSTSPYLLPKAQKQYGSGYFGREMKDLFERSKVFDSSEGKASFHSFRASFITNAEKNKIPREILQGIVGHNSPKMTEHYSQNHEAGKIITDLPEII